MIAFIFPIMMTLAWEHQGPVDNFAVYAKPNAAHVFKQITTCKQKQCTVKVDGRRNWWFSVKAIGGQFSSAGSNILYVPRGY